MEPSEPQAAAAAAASAPPEAPQASAVAPVAPVAPESSSTSPRTRRAKRRAQRPAEAAVWDAAAGSALLRLRFSTMRRQFEGARSKQSTGEVWQRLAAALSSEVGREFASGQCQSKVVACS